MSLPAAWVDHIFARLSITYGRDFVDRWEGLRLADVKADWARVLDGYEYHPEAIEYALNNVSLKPPTILEFRILCNRGPRHVPKYVAIEGPPSPPADPERLAREIAKAKALVTRYRNEDRARGRLQ